MKTVSIVIPCRNEAGYITACLDSIIASDYPKEYLSVYVCDGLSTDGTKEKIEEYAAQFPFIHLIVNEKQTTPYALNLGIRADNSDVAIILGAHSTIEPDFITNKGKFQSKKEIKWRIDNYYHRSYITIIICGVVFLIKR